MNKEMGICPFCGSENAMLVDPSTEGFYCPDCDSYFYC